MWHAHSVRTVAYNSASSPRDAYPWGNATLIAWLDALARLSRAVGDEMPLDDFFALAAGIGADLPGAHACAIQLASPNGSHLIIRGCTGLSDWYVSAVSDARQISLEPESTYFESPSSRSFRLGQIVCVDDVAADLGYAPWRELAIQEGYHSMAAIPLMGRTQPIGVLALYSQGTQIGSRENLKLFEVIANNIAGALALITLRRRESETMQRLEAANRALELQQEQLDRADTQHRGLMQLVFEGAGLDAIANWTAEALGTPVVIEHHEVVTVAGLEFLDATKPIDPRAILSGPIREHLMSVPAGVQFIPASPEGPGCWVAAIFLDGKAVGHLWALGTENPPDGLHMRLLERATLVASVELWRERYERELDWRLIGDLVDEIMTGDPAKAEVTRRRAAQVGVDLDREHVYVMFWPQARDSDTHMGTLVEPGAVVHPTAEGTVRRRGYTSVVAWRDQCLEVLIERPPDQDREALIADVLLMAQELSRALLGRPVIAVVSGICGRAADYPIARRATRAALEIAKRPREISTRVIDIASMGVSTLLLGSSRIEDLIRFRDECLGPLKEHDRRRGGQLLQTLRVHLETGGSNQATAQRLYLHANTVLYRLHNIEKICRIDLRDTEVMLRMQLAVLIDEIAGDG